MRKRDVTRIVWIWETNTKKRRESRPSGEFWAAFLCELCMAEGQFSAGDTECGTRNSQTIIVR